MEHILKTWPEAFEAVCAGTKTHEARKNDRNFEVLDTLLLEEWSPLDREACDWTKSTAGLEGTYTGRTARVLVTHVTKDGAYGLPKDLAVMSVRVLTDAEEALLLQPRWEEARAQAWHWPASPRAG